MRSDTGSHHDIDRVHDCLQAAVTQLTTPGGCPTIPVFNSLRDDQNAFPTHLRSLWVVNKKSRLGSGFANITCERMEALQDNNCLIADLLAATIPCIFYLN